MLRNTANGTPFCFGRLCIDTGGKQSNKENDRKRVQAKAKAHCAVELMSPPPTRSKMAARKTGTIPEAETDNPPQVKAVMAQKSGLQLRSRNG
jgi:hypothetical protein